jgi:hypothetical protein
MAKLRDGTRVYGSLTVDNNITASNVSASGLNASGLTSTTSLLVGGGTSSGTTATSLQVVGVNSSVYVGGNIGIGVTNPSTKLSLIGDSVFNGTAIFTGNRTTTLFRITQTGTGNALVVEDDTNPDATPFVVGAAGSVGIGITNPVAPLTVTDGNVGTPPQYPSDVAAFLTNQNTYTQINFTNTNSGDAASGDYVVTADVGTDTTEYIDMGINNSGFTTGASWSINGALDGYLYTATGNLSIGAASSKYLSLFTGGLALENERLRIDPNGVVGIGVTVFTSGTAQKLQVGSTSVSANAYVSGQVGIGSTIPFAKLAVHDDSASPVAQPVVYIQRTASIVSAGITNSDLRIKGHSATNKLYIDDQNSNPLMIVTGIGSVGIGTTNPQSTKLWVEGNTNIVGLLTVTSNATVTGNLTVSGGTITAGNVATNLLSGNTTTGVTLMGSQTSGTFILGGTSGTGTITLGRATTSQQTDIQAGASGIGTTKTINLGTGGLSGSITRINIGPTAGVGTVTINSGTNLGINSTTPTSSLSIVGDAVISGVVTATDFNALSDETLKTNVQLIESPIQKVMQLNGVTFNWRDNNEPSVGVIAQDVEKVFPELVHGLQPRTVSYNGLVGLLIECVKEQQKEIEELKKKLK